MGNVEPHAFLDLITVLKTISTAKSNERSVHIANMNFKGLSLESEARSSGSPRALVLVHLHVMK